MAGRPRPPGLLTVASRNGASTYRCLGCKVDLGALRRTDEGVRVFAVAVGVLARYREGFRSRLALVTGRGTSRR